ncbi:hypothetical protein B7693_04535 [Streptococcus mitis]|uniref:Peptidase S74 domain-containing protein n=1 Tax=Streptococcus mitis TaxID=28037 RepID=A0A1X1KU12_STRMT|nr:phage tail spike protein [Streptococcus mitis]ORP02789.1 hypothetical protein B7693_04535 [Streptococcus mitis]
MIYLTEGNTPLNEAYNDEIVQERNNTYQLTFRFPTSDPKWELLKEETFLTADDLHGEQDFYIFEVEKQQGYIQVYANQVISLLNNYIVSSIDVDRVSGTRVLSALAGSITRANPFSFFSDIDDRHTLSIKDKNAMEVLAKDKHSILGQWGGDMVRNGYNLRLLKNGGSENESLFMYKKNLSSYQHKTSTKSLKTRITFKTTVKGEGEKAPDVDYVVVIDSPLLGKYSQIYEAVVEVNDQNVKDRASLIEYGKQYFRTSMCDMLEDNLEISVVGQSDVAVRMFDVVSIYHEWYGLDVRKKITKYTYSPMAKRLKSIGFGTFQSSLANAIGGIVNDAVLNESRNLHQKFDERLKKEIANADRAFDAEFVKREKAITDGIELAKAKAEEVKQELSDTINQRFDSFDNASIQEAKRKAEESLRQSGASSLLAQEAKRIGLDSVAKLEAFKSQTTSAQTALSGDLGALKRTVTSEVSQASEYRRTTTEALSRMTGQMNGFATKSEVKQGIDGLTQTFAKMKVGSRNYAEDYDFSRGLWQYSQGDSSPQDWTILNGEYNVKGTTNTWKQLQIHSKEGSRASGKNSTALLELELGETYTLSFQGICYSGSPNVWVSLRANRTAPGNPEIMNGIFTLTSSWQTYQVTIPALTKPDNFDFWRIILGYNKIGHVAFRKVELTRSSTRIDAGPAPEDGKTDLVVAKSEFQKTAEGLSMKLAAVESYVGQDSQRQEVLQRYAREESAKQATVVRELIAKDYVGKSTYQEDVRGLERRFEAITNPKNGSIATQIANYKTAVDGRFTEIISQIAGKTNQTDFQRVKETSQLYERILGNTENGIADKVARMAMTNQLFQVEVSKNEGLKTVQRQLADSWSVQHINSAGDIISGINLGANGHNRITGKLTHITGDTLIDNAVIKSAMVDKLKTANFEAGSVTTTILDSEAVTAEKLKVDFALVKKLTANDAFIEQLTSKRIFSTKVESVITSSTVLEGYKGWIGGFQLGVHDSGSGRWITGRNHFSVGMGDGQGGVNASALWVNWGNNWNEPGHQAWFVKNSGRMYCKNTAEFWSTPIVHGDLKVTGNLIYDGGTWVYSPIYNKLTKERSQGEDWLYLYAQGGGRDWVHMNKQISDRRYKSNIQDSQVSGLDAVNNLKTYSYRKEYDGKIEDIACGIMAQDVQKYAPEAFFENPDGAYSYRTFELVPYLIKAIQELNQKLNLMEERYGSII